MSEKNNAKVLMAFLAGAAVGAAVGYFLNSNRKDELVSDLQDGVSNLKDEVDEGLGKARDFVNSFRKNESEPDANPQPKA